MSTCWPFWEAARYAALRPAASNWRALVAHPAQSLVALMALMASLTIRIDDDLKQRLRAQASRNGRSMAEEQMLREALMHQQPSPPAVAPEFYGTCPCSANNLISPKTGES